MRAKSAVPASIRLNADLYQMHGERALTLGYDQYHAFCKKEHMPDPFWRVFAQRCRAYAHVGKSPTAADFLEEAFGALEPLEPALIEKFADFLVGRNLAIRVGQ